MKSNIKAMICLIIVGFAFHSFSFNVQDADKKDADEKVQTLVNDAKEICDIQNPNPEKKSEINMLYEKCVCNILNPNPQKGSEDNPEYNMCLKTYPQTTEKGEPVAEAMYSGFRPTIRPVLKKNKKP